MSNRLAFLLVFFAPAVPEGKTELLPEPDTMFICSMPAEVAFRRDDQGKATSFLFHNETKDDPDVVFKRVGD